ncbi:hypothetical protein [Brevundimonas sp. GCM10030266]|uniref:hypothetical protein n=1 Tax=Brevundimonas sp. GCM10030266 TaxID=3273386 RepID=UPI0036071991
MLTNALIAVAITTAPMQDTPRPPALTNAEACLREKVADAVRVSSGATDAAEFLISYLCAGPVGAASSWQRNTEMLQNIKGVFDGLNLATSRTAIDADDAELSPEEQELNEAAAGMDFFGEGLDGVSIDPVSGEFLFSGEASGVAANMVRTQTGALGQLFNDPVPVFLRELAGRLVLEHSPRR